MNWAGEFFFGDVWVAFRGAAADNRHHAHAAIQVCLPLGDTVSLLDENDRRFEGSALVVRAGVRHRLEPIDRVVLLLIEPQSQVAEEVLQSVAEGGIVVAFEAFVERIALGAPLSDLLAGFDGAAGEASESLDSRLASALDFLVDAPLKNSISAAANECGLSQARLRAISKKRLGVPLSKWLTWRAIRRAAMELAGGASIAEAAHSGGFADQAHFTRTMGKMLGITPAQARRTLNV